MQGSHLGHYVAKEKDDGGCSRKWRGVDRFQGLGETESAGPGGREREGEEWGGLPGSWLADDHN